MASFSSNYELKQLHKVSENHPTIISQYGSHRGGGVYGVRFRPNMKHLVSGGSDSAVYLWSMHCRPNLRHPVVRPYRYLGHQGPVYAVAVCPFDTLVASGSRDKSIRLWIPTVEGKSTAIKGHTGPVRTVNFSHDGQWILSGSDDKTIKIWQVPNRRFVCSLSGHMNWVRWAEFSANGRQVVSGSDDRSVRLWDIQTHQCLTQFPDVLGEVRCARFHPDNTCIASGTSDKCIQMWDIRSKNLIQHYAANAGVVHSVCFHPAGNYLLSSCDDATLKIWDLREGQIVYTLQGHDGATRAAEFSPTGEFFVSGSADEHVVLWRTNVDLTRGEPDLQGIVRKEEVGHWLCSACNCVCTSAKGDVSLHGSSCVSPDNGSARRSPSPLRVTCTRLPTPAKKQNADSVHGSEGELKDAYLEERYNSTTLTVNIHKCHPNIEVSFEKSQPQAPGVDEDISTSQDCNSPCDSRENRRPLFNLVKKDMCDRCPTCEDSCPHQQSKADTAKTKNSVPLPDMRTFGRTLQVSQFQETS